MPDNAPLIDEVLTEKVELNQLFECRQELIRKANSKQDYDAIARQETDITELDESLVKKLIDKITVFADQFTVEFKSGITIEIEA